MYKYRHIHRVRFDEVDYERIVYHPFFLTYFEIARTEAFRNLNLPYSEMKKRNMGMPVIDANVQYKKMLLYDELVYIDVWIEKMPTSKVITKYEVYNSEMQLSCTGTIINCFFDTNRKKPVYCPDYIIEKLLPYFEEK